MSRHKERKSPAVAERGSLAGDSYVERERSLAFPALQSTHLVELLAVSQQMPRTAWLRHVRVWAQTQAGVGN